MNPLVSILIPAFNSQAWIADTIRSALAQTWMRKEIIIVDDGSRDQTYAIAKTFASKNVLACTQENQGAAAARNKALSLSQGDYIQWLDADDLLSPEKITRQLELASKVENKYKLLSSEWATFMHCLRRARFVPTSLWCDQAPVDWLVSKLAYNLHMQTATWLVSRELTNDAGPWDVRLSFDDDGEYFCRVLLKSEGVLFVPHAKVFYRLPTGGNLSTMGQSDTKMKSHLLSMQLHIEYLHRLEDSERVRQACLQYLHTWLPYYFPERPDIVKQLQAMAGSLRGELVMPTLPWKYAWLCKLFGWKVARRAQQALPAMRWSIERRVDKLLSMIENKPTQEGIAA